MQSIRSKNKRKIMNYLKKISYTYNIDLKLLIDNEVNIPTPLGYIIYRTKKLDYISYVPGEIIIRKENGNNPFKDPRVRLYHEYLKKVWIPKKADIYIGLPCTSVKPYSRSITHKMMNKYANLIRELCKLSVEIVSISEPMLIVPQKYEILFPLSNYDFPPKLMDPYEKNIMITKLAELLPKIINAAKREVIFVLPRHHYQIVTKALSLINVKYLTGFNTPTEYTLDSKVRIIKYGRLAFRTLYETFKYICNNHCRNKCKTN